MRKYIVSGCAIVDRVLPREKDGPVRLSLGGGAVYALSGIRLWNDACQLACYSGKDFASYFGPWLSKNGFSTEGVIPRFEKTNVCDLYYKDDGTHAMGAGNPDYAHPPGDTPDFALFCPYLEGDVKNLAIHLVAGYLGDLFEKLASYRNSGLLVGYEIDPEDPSFPHIAEDISRICQNYVDYFSISFAELKVIFPEMTEISKAIEYCQSLQCPVFLRAGEEGAYMIQDGAVFYCPMITSFGNTDPTGCGNTSTAAAFLAFCEGMPPQKAAIMGGVTAALNAGYKGLIPQISTELQKRCASMVHSLYLK